VSHAEAALSKWQIFLKQPIADFSAADELLISRNINGQGELSAADLADLLTGLGSESYLDLGDGNGVRFLGVGVETLASWLETNTGFLS
jgi:hypothetical protein